MQRTYLVQMVRERRLSATERVKKKSVQMVKYLCFYANAENAPCTNGARTEFLSYKNNQKAFTEKERSRPSYKPRSWILSNQIRLQIGNDQFGTVFSWTL